MWCIPTLIRLVAYLSGAFLTLSHGNMATKAPFLKVPCSTSTFWYTSTPAETCRGIPPYHVSEIRMVWQLGAAVQSSNVFFQRLQFHMSYHPTERLPARSENVPRLDLRSRRAPPSRWYKPSSRYLRIRNISESYHFSAHSSAFTPSLPHSSKLWQRICCIFVWDNSFVSPNSKCDIEEVQPMRPVCFAHE